MATDISSSVTVSRINGSLQRGGWQCAFTSLRDTDLVEANQNIILSWHPLLGSTRLECRTAFNGFVIPNRFQFDVASSTGDFSAETSDGYLRRGWCQGIGFADTNLVARTHYHQFDGVTGAIERMTMGLIVRHILGYYDTLGMPPGTNPDWVAHCNMVHHATENPHGWIDLSGVEMTPFTLANPDGTMRVDRYIVRETNNLWSRLTEIARNEFFVIYFDKTDQLHYVKHPMYQQVIPTPVMTFDENFCTMPPTVEDRAFKQVRQVILHAVTDAGLTLHSEYPPSPTHVYGKVEEITRIRCNDQDTLDDWCQTYYGYLNRDYTVRWSAPGLCGLLFEILDRIQITYSGTDANGVHIEWDKKKFWVHEISATPDSARGGRTEFLLEAEGE